MDEKVISDKEGISLVILFMVGSSSLFVMGLEAGKDVWLAIMLGIVLALPLVLIYIRLYYLFPGKDLFDIIEICFGKWLGKVIELLATLFVFYWATDVLVNYGNFIMTMNLTKTPQIVPMIGLVILCTWVVKKGIKTLGRWSKIFVIINIIAIFVTIALLIPQMEIDNIKPVFYGGIKPILLGAVNAFSFPFAQIFAFSMVFSNFEEKKSAKKVYIGGLLIGGILLTIISLTNILVIGINDALISYYPTYSAISRISIGKVLERLEVVVATIFVLGGFVKVSILLLCTCKGIEKAFGHRDYKFIIIPIALLIINLSYFQYDSIMDYYQFQAETWFGFTFPFEVILPIIIWIIVEIKRGNLKQKGV